MSQQDVRRPGGSEYVPDIDRRHAPRPSMRPAPAYAADDVDGEATELRQAYQAPPPTSAAPAAVDAARGQPRPAQDDDEGLVVFSKPYSAFGEELRSIKLRRPLAKDVRKCGYPLRPVLADDGVTLKGYDILADVIVKYIPLLSDPPLTPATVDQFEITDLNACSTVINGFFQR